MGRIIVAPRLWRLNSLFIIVVNKWNLRKIWERAWYEVHDLKTDHGRFIYDLDEGYMLKERILLESFSAKELWFLLKPYLESPSLQSWVLSIVTSVKSCWVLLYSGFVKSLLQVSLMRRSALDHAAWQFFKLTMTSKCVALGQGTLLCVLFYVIKLLHYYGL